jgi:hypothetical protein
MRFDFKIDKDKVIKSDEFPLNIWMPSDLRTNFVDGDEIFFDSANLKKKFFVTRSTHEEAKASWPFLEHPGRLPSAKYI